MKKEGLYIFFIFLIIILLKNVSADCFSRTPFGPFGEWGDNINFNPIACSDVPVLPNQIDSWCTSTKTTNCDCEFGQDCGQYQTVTEWYYPKNFPPTPPLAADHTPDLKKTTGWIKLVNAAPSCTICSICMKYDSITQKCVPDPSVDISGDNNCYYCACSGDSCTKEIDPNANVGKGKTCDENGNIVDDTSSDQNPPPITPSPAQPPTCDKDHVNTPYTNPSSYKQFICCKKTDGTYDYNSGTTCPSLSKCVIGSDSSDRTQFYNKDCNLVSKTCQSMYGKGYKDCGGTGYPNCCPVDSVCSFNPDREYQEATCCPPTTDPATLFIQRGWVGIPFTNKGKYTKEKDILACNTKPDECKYGASVGKFADKDKGNEISIVRCCKQGETTSSYTILNSAKILDLNIDFDLPFCGASCSSPGASVCITGDKSSNGQDLCCGSGTECAILNTDEARAKGCVPTKCDSSNGLRYHMCYGSGTMSAIKICCPEFFACGQTPDPSNLNNLKPICVNNNRDVIAPDRYMIDPSEGTYTLNLKHASFYFLRNKGESLEGVAYQITISNNVLPPSSQLILKYDPNKITNTHSVDIFSLTDEYVKNYCTLEQITLNSSSASTINLNVEGASLKIPQSSSGAVFILSEYKLTNCIQPQFEDFTGMPDAFPTDSTNANDKSSPGGCAIGRVIYEGKNDSHIIALREIRDKVLRKSFI